MGSRAVGDKSVVGEVDSCEETSFIDGVNANEPGERGGVPFEATSGLDSGDVALGDFRRNHRIWQKKMQS